ncbi:MAG: hypothetical protein AVDCRST_MAG45-1480, partial [uncultured Solirubrobacterales bacterium]
EGARARPAAEGHGVLAARLSGQHRRAGGHALLLPAAVDPAARPARALHSRAGAREFAPRGPGAQRPAHGLSGDRALDPRRRARSDPLLVDRLRNRGDRREHLARVVVLGRARHRVLSHLPRAVSLLGAPEGLRAGHARGRPAVHRRDDRRADASEPARGRTQRPAVRARRRRGPRVRRLARDQHRARLLDPLRYLLDGAEPAGSLAGRMARGAGRDARDHRRRLRLSRLPLDGLHARRRRDHARVHPHRPALVLRALAGHPLRRHDQRDPLRAARDRRVARQGL